MNYYIRRFLSKLNFLVSFGVRGFSWLRRSVAGFTLIETFVAITILMVAITGPLSIAFTGLNAALIAGDQITASYLAQDAIEYIRWVRDTNTLENENQQQGSPAIDWLANLSNCYSSTGLKTCQFDSTKDPNLSDPGCHQLYIGVSSCEAPTLCSTKGAACTVHMLYGLVPDNCSSPPGSLPTTGFYNYDCGYPTKFIRTISITTICNPNGAPCTGASASNEAIASTTVTWTDGSVTRSVTLREDLFNWQ